MAAVNFKICYNNAFWKQKYADMLYWCLPSQKTLATSKNIRLTYSIFHQSIQIDVGLR